MMRRPIIGITAAFAIVIFLFDSFFGYSTDILESFDGKTVSITGTVCEVSFKDEDYFQLILKDIVVDNDISYDRKVLVNVYSSLSDYLLLQGKSVSCSGEISIPKERSNPGCFDYRKYLKSINVRTVMSCSALEVTHGAKGVVALISSLRADVISTLNDETEDDRCGIVTGMIFGDTDYISDDTMTVFREGGTAHILAVSGLHIGIIYGFLLKFKRRKKSRLFDILTAVFLLFYASLCLFTPSVTRAVLMILIHILSKQLDRRYDFTCCICLAMIIQLLINPWQLFNLGFQLSFLAAFTMAVILPAFKDKVSSLMLPIVSIQAGMLPYMAYTFNYISLSSFICNIPVLYIGAVMIPLGVLLIPLCALNMADPLAYCLKYMADLLMKVNNFTYAGGLLTFDVKSPPVWLLCTIYIFLFVIFSETGRICLVRKDWMKIKKLASVAIAFSLCTSVFFYDGYGKCEYTFVDVGQGDCLHIREGRKNILIDGGGSYNFNIGEKTLKPYLLKNGAGHIDIAIVTHLHDDHFKGICELSKVMKIDTLCVYEGNRENEEEILKECNAEKIRYLSRGDRIKIGRKGCIEVVYPSEGASVSDEDENGSCLVIKVAIDDVSLLMTGDIDEDGEGNVISTAGNEICCDVLKVAHHGSRYSSSDSFIDAVNPKLAVISVGKNTYGHPNDEVLSKLEEKKIMMLRTDRNGAVGIDVKRGKICAIRTLH